MNKKIMVATTAILIGTLIYYAPAIRIKLYERDVDRLALTYKIHESELCPSNDVLKTIRDKYSHTVDSDNLKKLLWIMHEFDDRFMKTCLESSPHRSGK